MTVQDNMTTLRDKLLALLIEHLPDVLHRVAILDVVAAIEREARAEVNASWDHALDRLAGRSKP